MRYITIIFTLLLVTGCAKTPDIFDKFWEKVQIKMKSSDKIEQSDREIMKEATEEEWKEVDEQSETIIIPLKKPI
tara:strand:+ start:903 stop:1127 length:225 start_codon:yes stop_codon:yes gene_type:complete